MDVKKFFLSGYENATKDFYIDKISKPQNALIPHTHDYFQIYFCQRGKLTHHINNTSSQLLRGDVFVVAPGVTHFIEKKAEDTVFFSISFTYEFMKSREITNKFALDFLNSLLNGDFLFPKLTLNPDEIVFFECILGKMITEFTEKKTYSNNIIKDLLSTMLVIIARLSFENEDTHPKIFTKKQFIKYCISYIDVHCDENISLDDISKHSAMSKTTFCILFREATGMSFKEYLNKKRIQKAISLMKKGEKITHAARVSGYTEFSTFYRNFIKYTGYTPEDYVKEKIKRQ